MKRIKVWIRIALVKLLTPLVSRKTGLSKLQSAELITCAVPFYCGANRLPFQWQRFLWRVLINKVDWKQFRLSEAQFSDKAKTVNLLKDYREPIGTWFTIDSENTYDGAAKIQNTDTVTFYASGREPLLALANQIGSEHKVVLMPYFTCSTVSQPFQENNWKIVYYKVSRELRIDTNHVEALYEEYKPSLAVFMEYSGMDLTREELQTIGRLKQRGCVTAVDRTQNIYSESRAQEIDFYFGSIRKWYCIPDGAYLERNGDIPLPPEPPKDTYNDVYTTLRAVSMFTMGMLRKTKAAHYAGISYFCSKLAAIYICQQPVRLRNMSEYSKAVYLLEQSQDSRYAQQRKDNFRYVFHRIRSHSRVRPVCDDLNSYPSAPMCVNVYADDRDALIRFLESNGISALIMWKKPYFLDMVDEETAYIFQHILSLPCDQRYSEEDMRVLCEVLEAYELERQGTSPMPSPGESVSRRQA